MDYLWVTLLGRPGSGKTTVGQTLACSGHPDLGTVHYISGSRLLEEYIAAERRGWKPVKENKDHGFTADPELTHTLLRERIESIGGAGVVLLDGFPKSLAEVGRTEAAIPGGAVDLAILLDCPANECMARINHRLVCGDCSAVTSAHHGARASACRKAECDGTLVRRTDDDPNVLVRRQGYEPSAVLARHFRDLGRLAEVDTTPSPEVVIDEVVTTIKSHMEVPSPQSRG